MPYAAIPVALAQTLGLILARVAALFLLSPGFSQRQIPVAVRAAVTMALAAMTFLTIPPLHKPLAPSALVVAVLTQMVLGYLQGLLFTVTMESIASAGDLLDLQVGYAFAALIDPTRDTSPHALLSRLHNYAALAIFFALGGHLWVMGALIHSMRLAPLESAAVSAHFIDGVLLQAGGMLRGSLQLAAPVIAYLALVDVVTMVVSKSVPQLQIIGVVFPFKILVGLSGVSWFLPQIIDAVVNRLEQVYHLLAGG